jgi:SAM-dependent methyltransferase
MDGTDLDFPDNHFHFAFSFSSIEHFGGHQEAAQAVREMGRVIKPGGAVIITTEVILNGARYLDHFQPEELLTYLVEGSELDMLEDMDYSLSDRTLAHPVDFSHPGYNLVMPHIICQLGGVYWTSACLALQKPM